MRLNWAFTQASDRITRAVARTRISNTSRTFGTAVLIPVACQALAFILISAAFGTEETGSVAFLPDPYSVLYFVAKTVA